MDPPPNLSRIRQGGVFLNLITDQKRRAFGEGGRNIVSDGEIVNNPGM